MEGLDTAAMLTLIVFMIGYFLIIAEHRVKIDKATLALMTGILCWVIQYTQNPKFCSGESITCLGEHISSISQIIFFLLGALGIVEIISAHKGFVIISDSLQMTSKRKLLWTLSVIAFVLSAILDNLTTTIVMVTLLSKLIDRGEDRLIMGAAVVIAANAGGAWTPIGDVTTTMLWIGGEISTVAIMRALLLPSLISMVVAVFALSFMLKGDFEPKAIHFHEKQPEPMGKLVFYLGIGALVFVPIFKILTGLPPFMGVLFGLSVLWIVTDIAHNRFGDRDHLRMPNVLTKIDLSSLLFFLGILLAVDALDASGLLIDLAGWLELKVGNTALIATMIGLASAVVDNVPLVAAAMGMYTLEQYPQDHTFWQLIAFCAGTGGSILIIGSAAGVVYMGLEKATFGWYLKRISLPALVGYFAGIFVYWIS